MKAGLVRIASRSLLALAVVGLSACNDDPLDFNVKTATRIATNPSVMVLNSGGVQRLTVNTLNDGFEPTFDVPTLTEGAGCTVPVTGDVSIKELPPATGGGSSIDAPIDSVLATGAEPPNKYDITGVGLGETCLVGSFGSLSEEIPVTIVPAFISITGPAAIANGDFTTQTYTVLALDADSAANATWDVNAPYVTITSSDTLIASVTAIVSPTSVEMVRGPLGGDVDLTVTTEQNGVIRLSAFTIQVGKSVPAPSTVTPPTSQPGDTVTIDGTQLSIAALGGAPTIVSVGGNDVANVISESATQLVVVMPSYAIAGPYNIVVDVDGALSTVPLVWTQNVAFDPSGCEPGCENPGVNGLSVPFSFSHVNAGVDNFFTFGVSRDMTITFNIDWVDAAQDIDIAIVDGGFTAYVCTDAQTGAKPEQSVCHTADPGDYIYWIQFYSGPPNLNYTTDASVTGFP